MIKLLVIADDFTGALDTGVQFSKQGINTLVSIEINIDYKKIPDDVEVLVLNTETRHLSSKMAYDRIKKIMENANREKIPYIYKKVDSALRGNVSSEIKALKEMSNQEIIPFLPVYPEMNRVLINGNLYIDDVLVSESVFAEDPYEPVTESNIVLRLKQEADLNALLVKDDVIKKDAKGVLVFDAQKNETLVKHVNLLEEKNLLTISIGCAGFAKVLAQKLFPKEYEVTYELKKPIVVICGSVNPITKKQIEYVKNKNYPLVSLSIEQLITLDYWESVKGKNEIKRYLNLFNNNPLVVFETNSEQTTNEILNYSQENNIDIKEYRFKIGASLGKLTEALWSENNNHTFLFTGGDTLFQSMKVLGVKGIKPSIEIKPGVVLSTVDWRGEKMQVITKSGGFGKENLFEEISQLAENKEELDVIRL